MTMTQTVPQQVDDTVQEKGLGYASILVGMPVVFSAAGSFFGCVAANLPASIYNNAPWLQGYSEMWLKSAGTATGMAVGAALLSGVTAKSESAHTDVQMTEYNRRGKCLRAAFWGTAASVCLWTVAHMCSYSANDIMHKQSEKSVPVQQSANHYTYR